MALNLENYKGVFMGVSLLKKVKNLNDAKNTIEKLKKRIMSNDFKKDRAERAIVRDEHQINRLEKTLLRMEKSGGEKPEINTKINTDTINLPIEKEVEKEVIETREKTSLLSDLLFSDES